MRKVAPLAAVGLALLLAGCVEVVLPASDPSEPDPTDSEVEIDDSAGDEESDDAFSDDAESWVDYTSTDGSFSLSLPADWTFAESQDPETSGRAVGEVYDSFGDSRLLIDREMFGEPLGAACDTENLPVVELLDSYG